MSLISTPENINFPKNGVISSELLSELFTAISRDLRNIDGLLEKTAIPLSESLEGEVGKIDGKRIYVNSNAEIEDNGILYYDKAGSENKRPLTIHETFLLLFQLVANNKNMLSDGIYINETISVAGKSYPWAYSDHIFIDHLYEDDGSGNVRKATGITVSVDTTAKTIKVTPSSGKVIFGYIIHPSFNI
jgi:hypothetical protein